jgi:NAD(P)-dependent dehydrogenase (short-subunit alcohol dehydrogenase family)
VTTAPAPIQDLLRLAGKTAIVTGGAIGIGYGIAYRLAEAGANVVIADLDGQAAEDAARRHSRSNPQMPHGRRFGTLVTIQGHPSFVRHNWISSSLSSSFGSVTSPRARE